VSASADQEVPNGRLESMRAKKLAEQYKTDSSRPAHRLEAKMTRALDGSQCDNYHEESLI
jgi:hypothetical protein